MDRLAAAGKDASGDFGRLQREWSAFGDWDVHAPWSQGLFKAPALGGRVNAPLVKFTEQDPGAIKDWVEVWWDGNGTGNDELTKPGKGILQKANNGTRYTLGKWPAGLVSACTISPMRLPSDPLTSTASPGRS